MNKQFKGSIALLTATVIWGFAFIAQSVGMEGTLASRRVEEGLSRSFPG